MNIIIFGCKFPTKEPPVVCESDILSHLVGFSTTGFYPTATEKQKRSFSMTPGTQAMSQDSKITLEVQPPRKWRRYICRMVQVCSQPYCSKPEGAIFNANMSDTEPMMNLLHRLTIHSPPIFIIKYAMHQFYSCPHVFPDPLPLAGHCVTHLFGNNVFRQRLGWKSVQKLPKPILFGKTIYTIHMYR